jgi:hypothetical protein
MSRSIEIRLKRLEAASAPVEEPRLHVVFGSTPEEAAAEKAKLIAEGVASPDDLFIRIVSGEPDPDCHMYKNYRWENHQWVRKDGPYIP